MEKVIGTSGEMVTEKVDIVWRIENYFTVQKLKVLRDRQKLHFQAGSSIGLASDWTCSLRQRKEGLRRRKVTFIRVGLERIPTGVQELMASLKFKMKAEGCLNTTDFSSRETGARNLVRTYAGGLYRLPLGWHIDLICVCNCPQVNVCLVVEMELTLMRLKDAIPQPGNQQKIEALFKPTFTEKLQQDFGKLLEGHGKMNAKILTKDKVEFAVHRCILSERSPVFEKMFQMPMTEAQTGIVNIQDLSSKTMSVLLQFIYEGTLHQDWSEENVLPELVYAANKYELQDLVKFLDQVVGSICSKENAGRLLGLLGKVGMRKGEREVLAFIKSHMQSFEDMAKFVEEGAQQPDIKTQKSGIFRKMLTWKPVVD